MTRDGLKPDAGSRFAGLLLSGVLHLAAGLALLRTSDEGVPLRGPPGGDTGDVLVVELIPVGRAGGAQGTGTADAKERKPDTPPAVSSPAGPHGIADTAPVSRASGSPTADPAASSEKSGEAPEMADLPSAEVLAYRQRLEAHLARFRIYPANARSAGHQGTVTVHFSMTREGQVLDGWIETSSGISDLDAEALAAILRAQPLPAFPTEWPGRLNVSLPVAFRLG